MRRHSPGKGGVGEILKFMDVPKNSGILPPNHSNFAKSWCNKNCPKNLFQTLSSSSCLLVSLSSCEQTPLWDDTVGQTPSPVHIEHITWNERSKHMGVSQNRGIEIPPKWMVDFMENPTKMDDFGYFWKHPIWRCFTSRLGGFVYSWWFSLADSTIVNHHH